MAEQRIQKVLSDQGVCSRRAAEKLIDEGRVKVNGIWRLRPSCRVISNTVQGRLCHNFGQTVQKKLKNKAKRKTFWRFPLVCFSTK